MKKSNELDGIFSRLRKMEDKIDIIISDFERIHSRLYAEERQRKEDRFDIAIE